ncbi:hypothetical protein TSOC_001695 [Tetrabaena socialis]|uniref:Uncharacterized protein n=1 Tax=Tetrabaena socialis TaxID=47790 RepID=A0A2J8AG39_9CHLO|nr:hypothetical protein TSOC_001695 [Tetrabaena socialis]|eukprot:PNH11481.1 hypothetical protein TSOC_001695 [Tetrabaena socialis]
MSADTASAATVVVRRSAGGKAETASIKTSTELDVIDRLLHRAVELLNRAPSSLAPWKGKADARKRVATAEALGVERQQLQTLLRGLLDQADSHRNEAEVAVNRLMKADQAMREAQAAKVAAETSLQSTHAAAAQKVNLRDEQINLRDEQISALQAQVQALETEKSELQATIANSAQSATLQATIAKSAQDSGSAKLKQTTKELAEVTAEYQRVADVAEREIRRLQMELKKSEEAREAAVQHANQETASALADKTLQYKTLQRRYDSMKVMAETSKDAAAAAKKQVEEMAMQQAKAVDAAEAQARRLTELKGARDTATAEREALRSEHLMLHSAFVAAGGVDTQVVALLQAASKQGGTESGTRSALRARQGVCLHARPCGTAQDVNKVVPVPYTDAAQLVAAVREQNLFVCTTCLADGLF